MSLIDASYFIGELSIPNLSTESIAERLQVFIDKYEPEWLRFMFGHELSVLLIEQIRQDDENSPASDVSRLVDIITGKDYTGSDNKPYAWQGLVFEEGTTPRSPIANYIYWHWLKDQTTQTVGLGEVATKGENSTLVSPVVKQVRAWDEMSRMTQELVYFMRSNATVYPEWVNRGLVQRFAPQNQFGI